MNVNDSFCQLTMIVSVTTSHSMIVCVSFAEEADGVEVVSIKVGRGCGHCSRCSHCSDCSHCAH